MKLTDKHMKRLRVIIDMSVDCASKSLSGSLQTSSTIRVTDTSVRKVCDISEELNEDNREMVASLMEITGSGDGKALFAVEKEHAFLLRDLYLHEAAGTTDVYDECVASAMQELGNILSGSICNSIATDLGMTIVPTPPLVTCDYIGAMFSAMVMDSLFGEDDELILMDTVFELMKYDFKCYFFFIPGMKVVEKIELGAGL